MIDLKNIEKYRENNRIEAKKALGGLPKSIWETYSAFANTLGGIILLGVVEESDKTFRAIDLPYPEKLVKEFWDSVNNPNKASVNLLTDKNVRIESVDGKRIVVIEVPRAQRYYKPVYVDGNPVSGTYRRSGEGDYHCSEEELNAMYRDASVKTQDMLVIENMDSKVFCTDSIESYRQRMKQYRPGHVWEGLDDDQFLMKLGAAGIGNDDKIHPTAAGLLMFGYEYEIVREYPSFFLDYREGYDNGTRLTDRVYSSSGEWSGNIYDFYFRVYNKLTQSVKLDGNARVDDTSVHQALREALTNCLVNADYYGRQGVVIVNRPHLLTFSNPGDFRIGIETAKSGGLSDPRNGAIMKIFNLIDIGECAGNGVPRIFYTWKQQGWPEPSITHSLDPDRIVLSLQYWSNGDKSDDKHNDKIARGWSEIQKEIIVEYLTDHVDGSVAELSALLEVKSSRVKKLIYELTAEGIITAEGGNRNRRYRLKA